MKKLIYLTFYASLLLPYSIFAHSNEAITSKTINKNESEEIKPYNPSQDIKNSIYSESLLKTETVNIDPTILIPQEDINLEETNMFCRSTLSYGRNFEEKISGCSRIKDSIIWQTGSGELIPYDSWPLDKKNKLNQIFQAMENNEFSLNLFCDNPQATFTSNPIDTQYMSEQYAFNAYAAQVAHSIYLETHHLVNWSILNLPQIQLDELFNSSHYQSPIMDSPGRVYPNTIRPGRDFVTLFTSYKTLVCDPRLGWSFLNGIGSMSGERLIGNTPEETLANLTYWLRNNALHLTPDIMLHSYERATLLSRLRNFNYNRRNIIPLPAGCHSSAPLIYDLAKNANIPLIKIVVNDIDHPNPQDDFISRHHQGLVAFARTSHPKILYHMDEVLTFNYPLNSDGGIPALPDAKMNYFHTHWTDYTTLYRWGMHLRVDLPMLNRSSSEVIFSTYNSQNPFPNFGNLLGSIEFEPNSAYSTRPRLYQLLKAYDICGEEIVNDFCTSDDIAFRTTYGIKLRTPPGFTLPINRTPSDFFNRAAQCVTAYGGCESAISLQRLWGQSSAMTVLN